MSERESILPLAVGVVVALAAHVAVLPLAGEIIKRSERAALRVTDLAAPDEAIAGDAANVTYRVTNDGPGRASYSGSDRIYLSQDESLSADDTLLGTFTSPDRLEEGDHYDAALTLVLPPHVKGRMHLIVRADADARYAPLKPGLSEGPDQPAPDASSIRAFGKARLPGAPVASRPITITLPPRPDLIAAGLDAPRQVRLKETIQLSYTVTAQGEPIARDAVWRERVLLSFDDTPSADDAVLAEFERRGDQADALGAHDVQLTEPLPDRYVGEVYVIVQVDAGDAVDEYPHEDNNVLAAPLYVIRPKKDEPDKLTQTTQATKSKPKPKPMIEPAPDDDVKLGKDDAPDRLTVSWISYEDFQDLLGPKSRTEQSPLQRTVDPAPVAQMPDDPTPPATRSPKASRASSATQVVAPSPTPEVARQVEAESPVTKTAPPVLQLPAEAPVKANVPPTTQAKADAAETVERAKPIDQAAADTPRPQEGQPTNQPAAAAPTTVTTDPTKPGPAAQKVDAQLALVPREPSTADEKRDAPPTQQPAAQTDEPNPDGEPTKRDEAKALIKNDDGSATKQLPAKTPQPDPKGELATAKPVPAEAPPQPDARDLNRPAERDPQPTKKDDANTKPSPAPRDANPTAAPRDEREVPPAALAESLTVRPGKVLTTRGIEIQTVRPRFSIITLVSAFPRNPTAKLTFNGQGEVIEAELTRSTGYVDLDSPIRVSLYQWRAKGKELEKYPNGFTIKMNLILVGEE